MSVPLPLGNFVPGNIAANGTWVNSGSGGSDMDLSVIVGTGGSISRTVDGPTGLNQVTTTVDDVMLRSTLAVDIPDPSSFVLYLNSPGTQVDAAVVFTTRVDSGKRHFLFQDSGPADWSLGAGGGTSADQTFISGRLVIAGRFHTAGTLLDFFVANDVGGGQDIRNHVMGGTPETVWEWVSLFGSQAGTSQLIGSIGEIHVWDTQLTDPQYAQEISDMRSTWQV